MSHGGALEPQITRLKLEDNDLEGLEIELNGGRYNDRKQRAVVSFVCSDMTGNEGNADVEDKKQLRVRDDDDDDGEDGDDDEKKPSDRFKQNPNSALQFVSYGEENVGKEKYDVLRLEWKTKAACENSEGGSDDTTKKTGWGFFTWFILL